jgi:hypothetical protein
MNSNDYRFTVADNFGDSVNVVIYFKRDDFNFDIVNFPHLSSNIPSCNNVAPVTNLCLGEHLGFYY